MMIVGKMQRTKGANFEREIVNKHKELGIDAKRVPLSGATDFAKHDVMISGISAECKIRANGFKEIYKWLEDNPDVLICRCSLDNVGSIIEMVKNNKRWMRYVFYLLNSQYYLKKNYLSPCLNKPSLTMLNFVKKKIMNGFFLTIVKKFANGSMYHKRGSLGLLRILNDEKQIHKQIFGNRRVGICN
mgnify:CR=1 FL=1